MTVAGIVLAAGRSSRMGRPKALLEIEGRTFLERAIDTLAGAGCEPIVVVLAPGEAGERAGALARDLGAEAVGNPVPEAEQVDSLRLGLGSLPDRAEAVVVLPVDHPLADRETVEALIRAHRESAAPIVRPVYHDRPGHPVLFARSLWRELSDPDLERGARDVVHRHAGEIHDVPLEDRGVTVDVDTPDAYRREIEP